MMLSLTLPSDEHLFESHNVLLNVIPARTFHSTQLVTL